MYHLGKAAGKSVTIYRRPWKSEEYIRKVQGKALHRAVSIAYHYTQFYKDKYNSHGVHPDDIQSIDDLSKLPVITKKELIDNFENAVPALIDKESAFLLGTSGTTGQSFQLYKDYTWLAHGFAFALRTLKIHGIRFLPRVAFIFDSNSNTIIEKKTQSYFKYFSRGTAIIPVEEDMEQIMKKLEKTNVNYICTYTGVMRELATLRKNGMGRNLKIKMVGLTGEILDEYTRRHIEEAFGCKCYSAYISTEGGTIAQECRNKKMHIHTDFVTPEIVDSRGTPLPDGEDGLILLTCYDGSYSTPIIRYSGCADIGQILPEKCDCGFNTPIMANIRGRVVDAIHLPDGRVFHAFAMTIPMEKIQRNYSRGRIRRYQIEQHDLDRITISIVRDDSTADANDSLSDLLKIIEKTYSDQLGKSTSIVVKEKRFEELTRIDNDGMPMPLVLSHLKKYFHTHRAASIQ